MHTREPNAQGDQQQRERRDPTERATLTARAGQRRRGLGRSGSRLRRRGRRTRGDGRPAGVNC